MIWAVFDTNTDFTAGENRLQPPPLLGSHYAQYMSHFHGYFLYART